MMTPRKRAAILILLVIAIVLFLAFLLSSLFFRPKQTVQAPVESKSSAQQPAAPTISNQILKQEAETRNGSSDLIAFAKLFTERYGSYSNEANFQNIRDVIPLMSASFGAATQSGLATKKAPEGFYGVTTRAISVKVVKSDEKSGAAIIDVTTQRATEKDSAHNTTVTYQDIELTFVKESGVWKVDSATWR